MTPRLPPRAGAHPEELLSASLTGDLTDVERAALDAHLAACDQCSATLAGFREGRRLLSGMRHAPLPRDLAARVQAGIQVQPLPWWRRPATLLAGVASLGTVAAAVLAVVVFGSFVPPVAQTTPSPTVDRGSPAIATASGDPSPAATGSSATPEPDPFLQPGELGWLRLTGESFQALDLSFVKDVNGGSIRTAAPSGPPINSAISPDGTWLAYVTEVGELGANQVWVLRLRDGMTVQLGCTQPRPFDDRLAWSADSLFLAYTLAPIDPGPSVDCGGIEGGDGGTDVFVFRTDTAESVRQTATGDAFAADFAGTDAEGGSSLLISHAAEQPWTESVRLAEPLAPDDTPERLDGVFMPLYSPAGPSEVVYWRGTMGQLAADGEWRFIGGGMPYLADFSRLPPTEGSPLFNDLQPNEAEGFASGRLAWSATGDLVAFWAGAWGEHGPDGAAGYPNVLDVYVGRPGEGLSKESRLPVQVPEAGRVVDVTLDPASTHALVTVGYPSGGIGDPPSSALTAYPLAGGDPIPVGGTGSGPWDGPAVFGTEDEPGS